MTYSYSVSYVILRVDESVTHQHIGIKTSALIKDYDEMKSLVKLELPWNAPEFTITGIFLYTQTVQK